MELLLNLFRVKELERVGHKLKTLIRLIGYIERERWLKLAHSKGSKDGLLIVGERSVQDSGRICFVRGRISFGTN